MYARHAQHVACEFKDGVSAVWPEHDDACDRTSIQPTGCGSSSVPSFLVSDLKLPSASLMGNQLVHLAYIRGGIRRRGVEDFGRSVTKKT